MNEKEIEKLRKYLKNLRTELLEERIYTKDDGRIRQPQYVGKHLIWFLWKYREFNLVKSKGYSCFSFRLSGLTVTCQMRGTRCIYAFGYNDDPLEEPALLVEQKINALYASLLLSSKVSKEDIARIYEIKLEEIDSDLVDKIIMQMENVI